MTPLVFFVFRKKLIILQLGVFILRRKRPRSLSYGGQYMYSSLNLLPLIDTSNGKVLEKPETDNFNQILIRLLCLRISKKKDHTFEQHYTQMRMLIIR